MRERGSDRPAALGDLLWRLLPWAILAVAVLLRVYALGRLPGINGDEAWYGVQAQRWAAGEAMSWRTPTGNLPGPMQVGGLLLLQAIFAPSFLLLRVPSLISSLGAVALAYLIGRRYFDRTTGLVAMLLMAALPVNIVYARFGWDPSHVVLAVLIVIWATLARRPALAALAFALALAVHPTCVFAAPFVALTFLGVEMEGGNRRRAFLKLGLLVALLLVAIGLLSLTTSIEQTGLSGALILDRMMRFEDWVRFAALFGSLLSGETVYAHITGLDFGVARHVTAAAGSALVTGLLAAGVLGLRRRPDWQAAGMVAGWGASLVAFFLIASNQAIQPPVERYALTLIAPTIMVFAVLIRRLFPDERHQHQAVLLTSALACLLLAGMWLRYFAVLEHQPIESERRFWTGPREPKQVAAEKILNAVATTGSARVIAEDWWLYMPFAYLSLGRPVDILVAGNPRFPPVGSAIPGGTYWLVFGDGKLDRQIGAQRRARLRWTIPATGRPRAIHIWWAPAPKQSGLARLRGRQMSQFE